MATNTVAVRLPEDIIERLHQKAAKENKKLSDVMKDLILSGLDESPKSLDAALLDRLDKLEALLSKRLEAGDSDMSERLDALRVQLMEELSTPLGMSIGAALEARYFARLAAMFGMDIAHYVAQKIEPGVTPKPPDKDQQNKSIAFYEQKCAEFVRQRTAVSS